MKSISIAFNLMTLLGVRKGVSHVNCELFLPASKLSLSFMFYVLCRGGQGKNGWTSSTATLSLKHIKDMDTH